MIWDWWFCDFTIVSHAWVACPHIKLYQHLCLQPQLNGVLIIYNLKVKTEYNWTKITQDTHFAYQKAICQSMAEKQKRELEQERATKTKKAKNTEKEIGYE